MRDHENWRRVLDVNLWGVINGVHAFAPAMIGQTEPSAIVNTGSKQGITCPPGDTAYNVSKAGVKVVTEALAHELRNTEGCQGQRATPDPGLHLHRHDGGLRRGEAGWGWMPDQVVEFMLAPWPAGDFYILCPDNDVTRDIDERRILWAAADIMRTARPCRAGIPTSRTLSLSS